VNIDGPVGPEFGAFPEPPKGSPGGVRDAARSLQSAGRRLDDVAAGLRASAGGLGEDWKGDAAGRFRLATEGLATVARDAGATFDDCAATVRGYADALEHCQDELKRLKKAYDEAVAQATTAAGQVAQLTGALRVPDPAPHLAGQLSRASDAESQASGDAHQILGRAHNALNDFHDHARHAESVLNGQQVGHPERLPPGAHPMGFGPGPSVGVGNGLNPGFGIPMGGLSPYDGLVRVNDPWNNDVPGFSTYWDGTHPSAVPTEDLTNAVMFAAGGVGMIGIDGLRFAASEIAGSVARSLGMGSARGAARAAYDEALEEAVAIGRPGVARATSLRERWIAGRNAGRTAYAEESVRWRAARAATFRRALEIGSKLGLKIPDGFPELASHIYQYSTEYKYKILFYILDLRAKLAVKGVAGAAAAHLLDRMLGMPG
jgi:uncharacterized protein YukE